MAFIIGMSYCPKQIRRVIVIARLRIKETFLKPK
jgi:hypothetical protein